MKIVNLENFLTLPKNTVFSKFKPFVLADIEIKGDNVGDSDFYVQDISTAIADNYVEHLQKALQGEEIQFDFDSEIPDGLFEENQLFAIWNQSDVKRLITRLTECVDSPIEKPFTFLKFSVQSRYAIVLNAEDPESLYFEVDGRTIAADDHYGLYFVHKGSRDSIDYDDNISPDLQGEIDSVRRRLVGHALEQAILSLYHRFKGEQVIPIENLPHPQIVEAINSHYEGGWSQLIKDCLGD